jgi:hypothetical protein
MSFLQLYHVKQVKKFNPCPAPSLLLEAPSSPIHFDSCPFPPLDPILYELAMPVSDKDFRFRNNFQPPSSVIVSSESGSLSYHFPPHKGDLEEDFQR